MILDQIQNAACYRGLHPHIQAGLDYLSAFTTDAFAAGRDDIRGDRVFALRQEYVSKRLEDGKWESHHRHVDIQFIYEGVEQMGYAPVSSLETTRPYDEKSDCVIYQGAGQFFRVGPGWFTIFFPEDAHMPGLAIAESATVRKIVVKARLD